MDERDLECAEAFASAERDSAAERSRRAIMQEGTDDCVVCGKPIPVERRAVAPFATRCVFCQGSFERGKARHAL